MAVSPLVAVKGAKPLSNATTTFLTLRCVSSGTRGSITRNLISLSDRSYVEKRAVTICNCGISELQNSCIRGKIKTKSNPCFIKAAPRICRFDWIQSTAYHFATWSSKGVLVRRGKSSYSVKAAAQDLNNQAEPLPRCIVLDIEGTTTPISFVFEVLFPYARDNVGKHLSATFGTPETENDIKLLRLQVEDDLENGVPGAVPIPSDDAGKEKVIEALVTNVEAMIKADRKITALKQLQGHIWRTGFENDEIEAVVFEDVPFALEKWNAAGIKVYIYSSGSRLAQRLIFGNTKYGDLRKYLSGFFDTAVGNKREMRSYVEISESLGVDKPSDVLFLTDVYQEAVAAKEAATKNAILDKFGDNHVWMSKSQYVQGMGLFQRIMVSRP